MLFLIILLIYNSLLLTCGNLIDFAFGPCVGGECIESENKTFSYICHKDDFCYPSYIFKIDTYYSSGPCISGSCPPSHFCHTDNLCYYEILQQCDKQDECPNGYECKDLACRSLFLTEDEPITLKLPEQFLKYFDKSEIISSCLNKVCPDSYVCADKIKFPFCLPKKQINYYLTYQCKDTMIINGTNQCTKYSHLCDETSYKTLLTEKCPKTCNTCLSFESKEMYGDLVSKNGILICKKYQHLCNDYLYYDRMSQMCPITCGKKIIKIPPL
uniref:ShKT domain-containing protein n=1 Tax=Parastrongyloides trichosuri TaxID=131310 RepID=A0A0N4ZYT9_PARTI